jgi:hypothetical protein
MGTNEETNKHFGKINKASAEYAAMVIKGLIDEIPALKGLIYSQVELIEQRINGAFYQGYVRGEDHLVCPPLDKLGT